MSSRRTQVVTFLFGALGLLPIVVVLAIAGTQTPIWKVCIHIALLLFASASPVNVKPVSISLIFPVLHPAIVAFPPATAGLIGALGSIQKSQLRLSPDLLFVNRALVGFPAFLASLFYHWMAPEQDIWSLRSVLSMILAGYLYTTTNNALAVLLLRLRRSRRELSAFSTLLNSLRSFTLSLTLGLAMTLVYTVSEVLFIALAVLFYFNRETLYATIVNQTLYTQIINAMVKVIENADPYTKGHSERVAAYCQAIGKQLRFRPTELNRLHLIAMLHDLGKQSVPVEILRKKGRLTEEEFPLVRQHPEKGADMLRGISLFSASHLRAISEHHERWDGKGYPRGLAGENIDLWARIIAVADAFDAMTTDRPYRPAIEPEEALEELKRNAGTQFDPKIVSIFISVFNSPAVQEALRSRLHNTPPTSSSELDKLGSGQVRASYGATSTSS